MLKWLLLSAVVVALDLYTKHLVEAVLTFGEHVPVTSFFDLVLFYNQGAAFSFLANAGGWQRIFFSGLALIASVVIIRLLQKNLHQPRYCLALSLILAGALGNLWNRLVLGHVIDFLYFHYASYDWPAFNVADSAIFCGAALLIIDSLKKPQSA